MVIQLAFWHDKTTLSGMTGMETIRENLTLPSLPLIYQWPVSRVYFLYSEHLTWSKWTSSSEEELTNDLILEGSGSEATPPPLSGRVSLLRTFPSQEKDPVIPGNTFRANFLSSYRLKVNSSQSDLKLGLMESIRRVYPWSPITCMQSLRSGIESHSLGSPPESRPEILEEIPTEVTGSLEEFLVWIFS